VGSPNYICVTCQQSFTRRTSTNRHNLNLHGNNGEIVGTIEYLAGVSSGQYKPVYPNEYRRSRSRLLRTDKRVPITVPVPVTVVRDSMGDGERFRLGGDARWDGVGQYHQPYLQQQQTAPPLPSPIPPLPSPMGQGALASEMSNPTKTSNYWGISEEAMPKIVELTRLLFRHPDTFPNPDIIIQGAKHFCMMGDNSFLEEKLAYLSSVDAITHIEQPSPGHDDFVV
jgi:hypothetical protein